MMTPEAQPATPPRTREQRLHDTLARLRGDVDLWVATASPEEGGYLVPLSFLWDGEVLLIATPGASRTARNLSATGTARLGIGPTRDVVLVEASAEPMTADELSVEVGDAFAATTGFDPRQLAGYVFFRLRPVRVQAWREADELPGREIMRDGRWLEP